jgi:hypothetical protein
VPGKQRRRGQPAAFQLLDNPYTLESAYRAAAYFNRAGSSVSLSRLTALAQVATTGASLSGSKA